MAVLIVFQYPDEMIVDETSMGEAVAALRDQVNPRPDGIHVAMRESAEQVLNVFGLDADGEALVRPAPEAEHAPPFPGEQV